MNLVILQGRLGADPELRFTASGSAVTGARVATSKTWVDQQGRKQEQTEWSTLTIWGKRGEAFAKYLHKGDMVLVRGSLKTDQYDDKEGVKRYVTKVVVEDWEFCGGKKDRQDSGGDDRQERGRPASVGSQPRGKDPDDAPPPDDAFNAGDNDIPF